MLSRLFDRQKINLCDNNIDIKYFFIYKFYSGNIENRNLLPINAFCHDFYLIYVAPFDLLTLSDI